MSARRIMAAAAVKSCSRARSVFSPAPMMVCSPKPRPPVMVNVQVFMAAWSPSGGHRRERPHLGLWISAAPRCHAVDKYDPSGSGCGLPPRTVGVGGRVEPVLLPVKTNRHCGLVSQAQHLD